MIPFDTGFDAMTLFRSLLFTPGNNEKMISKAFTLDADAVILDLEDAVPPEEKPTARRIVSETISKARGHVYARVNSLPTGMTNEDIGKVVQPNITGIVLPKVMSAEDVRKADALLTETEKTLNIENGTTTILPIVETASGVVHAYEIAKSSNRVKAITFGAGDFTLDMGINWTEEGTESIYARSKVVVDAVAANKMPIDAVYTNVENLKGITQDARLGKQLGYKGKAIIHPSHIQPVNDIFSPSREELQWASGVVSAFEATMAEGKGATRFEGKMIDIMHYDRAKELLAMDKAITEQVVKKTQT
ncbi:MAG: HpcH/HpaI aldolase/citrate lyase family protein [Candidatus Bathyarchaeia archaeon]